jgi:hypothetical protein
VIDRSQWFLPEHLTHLYYAPSYPKLTTAERLRHNQLFGCYLNEQLIFFETTLTPYFARVAADPESPATLKAAVRDVIASEERHTSMFRELNRQAEPATYQARDFHFIQAPKLAMKSFRAVMMAPRLFPMLIWLTLLQEERSRYYSKEFLAHRETLEPHFVDVYLAHMQDEAGHAAVGEALLDVYWDRSRPWIRAVNARLFCWMMDEFFNAPKRAGLNVVRQLIREFPTLESRAPGLVDEVRSLVRSDTFHLSLYSRNIVPKSFARFDRCPEFHGLSRVLRGYSA